LLSDNPELNRFVNVGDLCVPVAACKKVFAVLTVAMLLIAGAVRLTIALFLVE